MDKEVLQLHGAAFVHAPFAQGGVERTVAFAQFGFHEYLPHDRVDERRVHAVSPEKPCARQVAAEPFGVAGGNGIGRRVSLFELSGQPSPVENAIWRLQPPVFGVPDRAPRRQDRDPDFERFRRPARRFTSSQRTPPARHDSTHIERRIVRDGQHESFERWDQQAVDLLVADLLDVGLRLNVEPLCRRASPGAWATTCGAVRRRTPLRASRRFRGGCVLAGFRP